MTTQKALVADASNRSVRTFVQGLAINVAVGVSVVVLDQLDEVSTKAGLVVFGLSLGRTVAQSAAAFVMRMWVDRSTFPTPLPPGETR